MAKHDYNNLRCKIRPTRDQRQALYRLADARLNLWNAIHSGRSVEDLKHQLRPTTPSDVLYRVAKDYRNCRGVRRFISRDAARPTFRLGVSSARLNGDVLTVPGLGDLRLRGYRPLKGCKILGYQFSRDDVGDWWVTVCRVLTALPASIPPSHVDEVIGVDLGLTTLATSSSGRKVENPRWGLAAKPRISALIERLKNATQGSRNWKRLQHKLARLLRRVARLRHDTIHQLSRRVVDGCEGIGLESLDAAGISDNHGSNRDASIGRLLWAILYKCHQAGRPVHQVGRYFPSSQLCSRCGRRHGPHPVEIREWTCPCGAHHDRDVNAATNLKHEALAAFRRRGWLTPSTTRATG